MAGDEEVAGLLAAKLQVIDPEDPPAQGLRRVVEGTLVVAVEAVVEALQALLS